jgi:hypothetical protein
MGHIELPGFEGLRNQCVARRNSEQDFDRGVNPAIPWRGVTIGCGAIWHGHRQNHPDPCAYFPVPVHDFSSADEFEFLTEKIKHLSI